MSDKTVIGITGNIASGKSMVLRMLQELGADVIDADKLAHQLMRKDTPVYEQVVREFGKFILDPESGEINRSRLGRIVFSMPEALARLDEITHPVVRETIAQKVTASQKKLVAIEAVKLFEAGLSQDCTANWIVVAKPEMQLKRLVEKRHMSPDQAKQRIRAQGQIDQKRLSAADAIIDNSGDLGKTWASVKKNFSSIGSSAQTAPAPEPEPTPASSASPPADGEVVIRRAKREDLGAMAELISQATSNAISLDVSDMMEAIFSRGFIVAEMGGKPVGIAAWQTENLVAGLQDFYVMNEGMWQTIGKQMLDWVHQEIDSLSCEVSLVFVMNKAGDAPIKFFEEADYEQTESKKLGYIWKDAAKEWQPDDSTLLFKKLRDKRIMVPM